jgi:hypothetical protein
MEQALVGQAVTQEDRVRTMATMRAVRNVGMTIGALLGTLALALDSRPVYDGVVLLNAASFVGLAALAASLSARAGAGSARRIVSMRVLRDTPYLLLATLNGILSLHMTLLSVGVPLWIAEHSHAPKAIIAPLLIVNTVLAVGFQVRASRGADTVTGAAVRMRLAGAALALCCLLLAAVPPLPVVAAIPLLAAAMVALTCGELFQSAGAWGVSYQLARDEEQAAYLSVFWLGVSVQQILGPLLVAAVLFAGSSACVGLAALMVLVGLAVPASARWAQASRAREIPDVVECVAAPAA